VEVDHDHRGLAPRLLDQRLHSGEWALEGRERHLAEQVDDGDAVVHSEATAGRIRREVGRPQHAVGPREVRREVALSPDPVAERDHVGSRGEEPLGDLRRDPTAVGGVFAVDDAEVRAELLAQRAEMRLDGPPPRRAEHVGDEEDSHCAPRKRQASAVGADKRRLISASSRRQPSDCPDKRRLIALRASARLQVADADGRVGKAATT
jgi:hypothetical protein